MATEAKPQPETEPRADGKNRTHHDGRPPRLSDGIELIGEYEDSGLKEAPSIARRDDGQVIQLPKILYNVAESIDGRRDYAEIGERVTEATGRGLGPDEIRFLVDEKLRPLGIVAGANGESASQEKADPMLALKFRVALIPEHIVQAITSAFYPLYFPLVVVGAVAALIAFDIWMLFFHGVAQAARSIAYNPVLLFMVLGLVVLATVLHEIGHATAARYGGAKPGVMGAGIYVVWPAFYSDVTDAYRLGRGGRLRTDLGGIYFNALFALGTAGVYLLTGFEPLLAVVLLQHFQILQQLLPFLRLDGYYILSDLTGIPDLFKRIKPTLTSLLPGKTDDRVEELKPWVRAIVVVWVVLLVPVLLFIFGSMVINAPRIVATAFDSFLVQYDKARSSFDEGHTAQGLLAGVQMATLTLVVMGMALSSVRASSKALRGGWRWSEDSSRRRLALLAGTAVLAAGIGYLWWPNGEYKPIQRGERGTIQGALAQFWAIPSGRPSLTAKREQELGGAPTLREQSPDGLNVPGPGRPVGDAPGRTLPTGGPTVPVPKVTSKRPTTIVPSVTPGTTTTIDPGTTTIVDPGTTTTVEPGTTTGSAGTTTALP